MTLHDPRRRLHEVEVSLFSPFRPMLAQQCNVRFVDTCFTSSPATSFYYAETKHDGERFQLHFGDGAFRYFSKYVSLIHYWPGITTYVSLLSGRVTNTPVSTAATARRGF